MWFAAVLLAAMWISTIAASLPAILAATALAVTALVLGIRAIIALRRERIGGFLLIVLVVSLGLNLLLLLSSAAQLMFWQEYVEFADCMRRAITNSARNECNSALEEALMSRTWGSFVGQGPSSGLPAAVSSG